MKRLSQRISEREKRINKEFDLMMEDIEEMDGSLYFPFWKFLKEKQQVYDFLKYLRWFYNLTIRKNAPKGMTAGGGLA